MKVLRYAGISRREPLHIEVSTAGNNPDSYGKEQFDNALKVEKAEPGYEDDSLLVIVYAAPQDLLDSDLDADPAKYGKLANPTWGRIVKPGEFLAEYQTAKRSIADLQTFKMYRLNIWQQSSNPWLRTSDWEACKDGFTEADLHGESAYAGLDLSKTRDMTALALVFPAVFELDFTPEDGPYYILPYFWLPEETAHKYAHLAPFLAWAAQGYLTLTPGNVVDYGFVKAQFRKLAKVFKIGKLYYDRTYAEETTQNLEQGTTDDEGNVIEEGTGVEREEFPQTTKVFAGPTADFERLVIAGRLWHNGHPVMAWQIGHVRVRADANSNKRPVKPTQDDHRKIDGVVAGIMALFGAMQAEPGGSVYDTRPLEWI
jgi:phage terminase large subunit-like protein